MSFGPCVINIALLRLGLYHRCPWAELSHVYWHHFLPHPMTLVTLVTMEIVTQFFFFFYVAVSMLSECGNHLMCTGGSNTGNMYVEPFPVFAKKKKKKSQTTKSQNCRQSVTLCLAVSCCTIKQHTLYMYQINQYQWLSWKNVCFETRRTRFNPW